MNKKSDDVKKSQWYIYMILTSKDTLYTGICTNLTRRFTEHETGNGAKYFRTCKPIKYRYVELSVSRSTASSREAEIKKMSQAKKHQLIQASEGITQSLLKQTQPN